MPGLGAHRRRLRPRAPRARARPRGAAQGHERVRARDGRADAAARALQRRLLADARRGPAGGDRRARARARDGCVRSAFYRSLIRSDERLDYDRVDRIFAGAERAARAVGAAAAPARGRPPRRSAGARAARGALEVESEEPEFSFDERGEPVAIEPREQTESHRLIEHLMIAANEPSRALLAARGDPVPVPRARAPGRRSGSSGSSDQLASLEVPTPPVPEPMSPSQAAELVGEISQAVERYARRTRARADRARLAGPALAQAGLLLARATSATPACARALLPLHLADPPLSRTSSATARCCPRSASASTRRARRSSRSSASGPPSASARRPRSSATPTTSPAASCSSGCCEREGAGRVSRARSSA